MSAQRDSFLAGIVSRRRAEVSARFGTMSAADLGRLASESRPPRDMARALSAGPDVAVIAEVKRRSPSAGTIAPDVAAADQALRYRAGGAAAISVLTEPELFGGSFEDLGDVTDSVDLPVLCKDFVVDPAQLLAARGYGADAVLLMVSVLGEEVVDYLGGVRALGMQAMVEVRDKGELDVACAAGARLVAVNARDLDTLEVDRDRALQVVRQAHRSGLTTVAASGVRTRADVEAAAEAGADAMLVGEALMRAARPAARLAALTGVPKAARVGSGGG